MSAFYFETLTNNFIKQVICLILYIYTLSLTVVPILFTVMLLLAYLSEKNNNMHVQTYTHTYIPFSQTRVVMFVSERTGTLNHEVVTL